MTGLVPTSYTKQEKTPMPAPRTIATLDLMFTEQRIEPRESLALPVTLGDGQAAMTRDISASGMYLEVNGWHQIDGPIVFEIRLAHAGMKFTAQGEIVRVEHSCGKTGIAVRLISPHLQSLR
jgi:hypothetical protein